MGFYDYKAVAADGRTVRGRIEAQNPDDLETRLRRLQLELIAGTPARPGTQLRTRIARREIINFCFHLEQLTRAGVGIHEALKDLRDSLDHPRFREVVAGLVEALAGGQTLSQAIASQRQVFGEVFVSLIRAGEVSGQLPDVLAQLGAALKWEDEIAAQTRKAILYPAFVGTLVLAAVVFLMLYLVPQLKPFVGNMGQSLPPPTRALFWLSDLLAERWPFALAIPFALAGAGLILRRSAEARDRCDGLRLRLPVVGAILRKLALSRFTSTFALMYAAGIPVLESLRITREVAGNRVVGNALERVEQLIREGRGLTPAFESTGIFPPLVVRMLRVGENTGRLDSALANVSYFYQRDVRESVARLQAMIEPLLTAVLGVLLGWIMLAILGPMYDAISKVRT